MKSNIMDNDVLRADKMFKDAMGYMNAFFFKDYDKAEELFTSAAAQYKLKRLYRKAAEAYIRSGECSMKSKEPYMAIQAYVNAANCVKKVDMKEAKKIFAKAIEHCIESNRLAQAAKLEKEFAEALENDCDFKSDYDKLNVEQKMTKENIIEHYLNAANYFFAEDQPQSAIQCRVKAANVYSEMEEFQKCVSLYEDIGKFYCNNSFASLTHLAKEYFVKAILCRLALINESNRSVISEECMETLHFYIGICSDMKFSREEEYLTLIIESTEEIDVEKFEKAVRQIEELRMLDEWKTRVLLVIKKSFEDMK